MCADEAWGYGAHESRLIGSALNASGLTLVVVTHDPQIGERAGRLLRLRDGRIVEDIRRGPARSSA